MVIGTAPVPELIFFMGKATFKNILSDLGSVSRTEHANQGQRVDLLIDTLYLRYFVFIFVL